MKQLVFFFSVFSQVWLTLERGEMTVTLPFVVLKGDPAET